MFKFTNEKPQIWTRAINSITAVSSGQPWCYTSQGQDIFSNMEPIKKITFSVFDKDNKISFVELKYPFKPNLRVYTNFSLYI